MAAPLRTNRDRAGTPARTARRAVLVGAAGALGIALVGPGSGGGVRTVTLGQRHEAALVGLARLVRSYPSASSGVLVVVSTGEALPGLRARFEELEPARRHAVRRGLAWWDAHVDLTSVERARTTLRQASPGAADAPVLEGVVEACSLAVAEAVPRLTGANGSVGALWLSGFAGTAVSPWRRG